MQSKGKLEVWKDDKAYGFIRPLTAGSQFFVHIKAFSNRSRRPVVGEVPSYSVGKDGQLFLDWLRAKESLHRGIR